MRAKNTPTARGVVPIRCLRSHEIYLLHVYQQFMNYRYEIYGFSYPMIWMSDSKPRLGAKIFVWAMTGCAEHGSDRGAGSQETFPSGEIARINSNVYSPTCPSISTMLHRQWMSRLHPRPGKSQAGRQRKTPAIGQAKWG